MRTLFLVFTVLVLPMLAQYLLIKKTRLSSGLMMPIMFFIVGLVFWFNAGIVSDRNGVVLFGKSFISLLYYNIPTIFLLVVYFLMRFKGYK